MQEYLREYTGSSRQGLGADTASEAAQAANSTARTQHGRGHTDQRGAGAAGGTAQKETQRRSTFGSTPAAVNLISGNNNATQPGARAPGGGETVRLEGGTWQRYVHVRGERSSQSAFGSAPAAAPPQLFTAWAQEGAAACHRGEGEV